MKQFSDKRIVMVGAGNLAWCLSSALMNAGHQVVQVFSRTSSAARELAHTLNASWTNKASDITDQGDIYILSVSDSALSHLISQIEIDSQIMVHTSGSLDIEVFTSKAKNYGVLYPLQTFSKTRSVDFSEIPVIIEGNNADSEKALLTLGKQISNKVLTLNSEDRLYLHLAAVFACNFTNHFYHLASLLLEKRDLSLDLLMPLINETADKIGMIHPAKGQTGPAIRNDQNVIKKHLDLLSFSPGIRELYEVMSRSIFSFSQKE